MWLKLACIEGSPMARAIALRSDFTGPDLHRQARSNKDARRPAGFWRWL